LAVYKIFGKMFLPITMNLNSQLETILFVASRPVSVKKLAKILNSTPEEINAAMEILMSKFNEEGSGIKILKNNDEWQMVSDSQNWAVAEKFVKAEITGELTRPQLETLTVISYCSPITKPELEQIRGVNCSLILRNLMMRGLVKESDDKTKLLPSYEITMEYLRHLGLESLEQLPDYEELHRHEFVKKALEDKVQIQMPLQPSKQD